jgi:hypothetical protein
MIPAFAFAFGEGGALSIIKTPNQLFFSSVISSIREFCNPINQGNRKALVQKRKPISISQWQLYSSALLKT